MGSDSNTTGVCFQCAGTPSLSPAIVSIANKYRSRPFSTALYHVRIRPSPLIRATATRLAESDFHPRLRVQSSPKNGEQVSPIPPWQAASTRRAQAGTEARLLHSDILLSHVLRELPGYVSSWLEPVAPPRLRPLTLA